MYSYLVVSRGIDSELSRRHSLSDIESVNLSTLTWSERNDEVLAAIVYIPLRSPTLFQDGIRYAPTHNYLTRSNLQVQRTVLSANHQEFVEPGPASCQRPFED